MKDPRYRANPQRSLFVQGEINQDLVDRLTPSIIGLLNDSREPITIYIDSPGGSPDLAQSILGLLRAPNQDGSPPCTLITVATVLAASAAADFLASGDYAIAHSGASVYFHGTRTSTRSPVTFQGATSLTRHLRQENDRYALELARRSIERFIFRYIVQRKGFDAYRSAQDKTQEDLECFIGVTVPLVSSRATEIMRAALVKNRRYRALQAHMLKKLVKAPSTKRRAEVEAIFLRAVIDFELSSNKNPLWNLRDDLATVTEDFLLLTEFLGRHADPQITQLCDRWGGFFVTDEDVRALAALPEDRRAEARLDKLRLIFQPLWFFFVALCQSLQDGENSLSATDAFWLGLIDEVIGQDLPCYRLAIENAPNQAGGATDS